MPASPQAVFGIPRQGGLRWNPDGWRLVGHDQKRRNKSSRGEGPNHLHSCPYSPECVERLYEKWSSEGIWLPQHARESRTRRLPSEGSRRFLATVLAAPEGESVHDPACEPRRTRHRRTSGSVKLHSWVA